MSTKLYVGNVSYRATEEDLIKKFSEAGNPVSAKIVHDRFTGKPRGFAFVEMATEEEAQEAIRKLHNASIYGRSLVVNEARKPKAGEGGPHRR